MNNTATKPVEPEPEEETPREKFVRLATGRAKTAVKYLRSLGTMGGRSYYEYTQDDVDKIVGLLEVELNAMAFKLTPTGKRSEIEFDL